MGNRDDTRLEGCADPREEVGTGLGAEGGATEGDGGGPSLSADEACRAAFSD